MVIKAGSSFIVAFNNYRWCFENAVKAFDFCFKLIHVSYALVFFQWCGMTVPEITLYLFVAQMKKTVMQESGKQ